MLKLRAATEVQVWLLKVTEMSRCQVVQECLVTLACLVVLVAMVVISTLVVATAPQVQAAFHPVLTATMEATKVDP